MSLALVQTVRLEQETPAEAFRRAADLYEGGDELDALDVVEEVARTRRAFLAEARIAEVREEERRIEGSVTP